MRILLSLVTVASLSSVAYAGFESMDCSFEWFSTNTNVQRYFPEDASSLGSSPKNTAPNSPRLLSSSVNSRLGSPRMGSSHASSPRADSSPSLLQSLHSSLSSVGGESVSKPESPKGRPRRLSIERREESDDTHSGGSALFALNGNQSSIQFEIVEGCSIRFDLKGTLEEAVAGVFVFCKNRTLGKNAQKNFELNPDQHFQNEFVMDYALPTNAAVFEKKHPINGGGLKREVTRFVAKCHTFDPVAADSEQEGVFRLEDAEAEPLVDSDSVLENPQLN